MSAPPIRVAVTSSKGGTGKTSTTSAVASILARDGRRVLVLDLDPQGDATFALGGDPQRPGAAAFLLGEAPEPEAIGPGLAVLAGGPRLESEEVERADPEALLDALSGLSFDAVVIDSPPGTPALRRLALVAGTVALVPCSAHPFSVRAASEILREIDGRKDRGRPVAARAALVANMIDARRAMDAEFAAALRERFGAAARVFEVRQDAALAAATAAREPVAFAEAMKGNRRSLSDLEAVAAWAVDAEAAATEGA